MYEYEGIKRIVYGDSGATFIPVCILCGRFVKADYTLKFNKEYAFDEHKPNGTCKKHGRIKMIFEGYY